MLQSQTVASTTILLSISTLTASQNECCLSVCLVCYGGLMLRFAIANMHACGIRYFPDLFIRKVIIFLQVSRLKVLKLST